MTTTGAEPVRVKLTEAEAVRRMVKADDEWTAATDAYNAEHKKQRALGVFPLQLRSEEGRHSRARADWYSAVRDVIAAGRAALQEVQDGR